MYSLFLSTVFPSYFKPVCIAESLNVLKEMVSQMISAHPHVQWLHIGADEVTVLLLVSHGILHFFTYKADFIKVCNDNNREHVFDVGDFISKRPRVLSFCPEIKTQHRKRVQCNEDYSFFFILVF